MPLRAAHSVAARSRFKSCLVSTTAMAGLAAVLASAAPAHTALAAAGLLLFAPNLNDDTVSISSTKADGSLNTPSTVSVGMQPLFIAVRGDQAFAYVTNSTSDTVSVIDTSTNTVIQTIATGTNAGGIALTPDGSQLYVANQGANTVSAYTVDTSTGLLTANGSISTGTVPVGPAISPDGTRLYIPNFSSNSVTVVNTATNSVVTTVNVGTNPITVAVSPDNSTVYVANTGGNNISIIDTASNTVSGTVTSGNAPKGIAVRPDGKFYYSADTSSGVITAYDAATDSSIGTLASSDLIYVAVSPDGSTLYAANQGSTDAVTYFSINAGTGLLTNDGSVSVGNDPYGIAMCSNGDALLKTGRTFVANTAGALGCTGTSADFTGGTLKVNGSGLDFTTAVALGASGGTINTNGNNATISSSISGTGSLTKSGTGTLTLTGSNSYSGGTTISGGTLVGDTTSLTGNITDNAALTFNQAADGAFSGNISGTGSFTKTGAGTLTLTGSNSYSGGTTISGGTLVGDTASLTGNITNNAALTFNQTTTDTFSGNITGTGSFTKTGADTLTLTGTNSYTGGTTISEGALVGDATSLTGDITDNATLVFDQVANGAFAGNISGTGALAKTAAGTLTLSGNNSYTGTTIISAGTLKAAATHVLGTNSAVDLSPTATLDLNGFDQSIGSLNGDGTVLLGAAALTVGGDNSTTAYIGTISGSGSLIKTGSGKLTLLFNTNTYSGGTTISGGTLEGDTSSLPGNIVDNAALTFRQAADGTFAGNISGTGSVAKTEAGTLTLTGTNSYSGGTTISAGKLVGDTNSLTGNITNNTALTFNQTADGVFSGDVSGTGYLIKAGAGTLTLAGSNSYSGGTLVSSGTLVGDTASLTGSITNNAALVFDQAADGVFSGSVSGMGTLTKSGGGAVNFDADSSVSAASLMVEAGHLAINGDASSTPVTVAAGASLGGNGHFGTLTLESGATVAPGNSIGDLNVGGDVTFAPGTIYAVEVDAAGHADTITVAGTATLDGSVHVLPMDGDYAPETSYTILTAATLAGRFADVSSNFAFLAPTLAYGDKAVTLTLERNDLSFAGAAATANQKAAGGAAEQTFVSGDQLYTILISSTLDEARSAFDQLSGEVHAAVIGSVVDEASTVRRALLSRDPNPPDGDTARLWVQFLGNWTSRTATTNEAAVDGFSRGFLVGADQRLGGHAGIGMVAGYSSGRMDLAARLSHAEIKTAHVGVHGLLAVGGITARAGVTHGFLTVDTRRTPSFGGFTEQLRAQYNASVTQAFGELSHRLVQGRGMLEPYAGVAAAWVGKDAYSESGGDAALTDSGRGQNFSWSTLGLRGAMTFGDRRPVSLKGSVAWQHALNTAAVSATLAFTGSDNFTVTGAPLSEDSVLLDAGIGWQVGQGVSLDLAYSGEVGDSRTSHAVNVGLNVGF